MAGEPSRRSGTRSKGVGEPQCSFCGKSHKKVKKLVAGPGVYICDACLGLCNAILTDARHQDTSRGWQGWASMSDAELLETLPGALRTAEQVRDGVQARIDELRRREVSWSRIGEILGMSRQAAWERFA